MALCIVQPDGTILRSCEDPPLGSNDIVLNWAIAKITGAERADSADLTRSDLVLLAETGQYRRYDESRVSFALPTKLAAVVAMRLAPPRKNRGGLQA
jgi:hypothetical protein